MFEKREFTIIHETERFLVECDPIVQELHKIYTENQIPYFFCVAVENDSDKTDYIVRDNMKELNYPSLCVDHMYHHQRIMDGYVAKPPREEVILSLDSFLSGTPDVPDQAAPQIVHEHDMICMNKDIEKKCKALLKALHKHCFILSIPYFFTAVTKNDGEHTEYVSEGIMTGSSCIKLKTDAIKYHMMVMDGCVSAPGREETILCLDDYFQTYSDLEIPGGTPKVF